MMHTTMSGRPLEQTESAVQLYNKYCVQLDAAGLEVSDEIRAAFLKTSARALGVHRTTLYRALHPSGRGKKRVKRTRGK